MGKPNCSLHTPIWIKGSITKKQPTKEFADNSKIWWENYSVTKRLDELVCILSRLQ